MDAIDSVAVRLGLSAVVATYFSVAHVAISPGIGPEWLRIARDFALGAMVFWYIWRGVRV